MTEVRGDVLAAPTTPRRRLWLVLAVAATLAMATPWVVAASRGGRAGGDPGGLRLQALRQVAAALPAGADVEQRTEAAPLWGSCDGRPGTEGWSTVLVAYQFTAGLPKQRVRAHVAAEMTALHWTAAGSSPSPLGPVLEWTRDVRPGVPAHAQLSLGQSGPGHAAYWELTAMAPPEGKAASGC